VTLQRRALGTSGEDAAAAWYVDQGYEVVARNWRCRDGELDLIVRQGRTYVFCEVKTRTSDAFGVPAEAITRTKRTRIRHLAAKWLSEVCTTPARDIRFDVVAILGDDLQVIEGAF
jgi:putative endonuclease